MSEGLVHLGNTRTRFVSEGILRNRPRRHTKAMLFACAIFVIILLSAYFTWRKVPRRWSFLPHGLSVNAGTNGDGSLGYPPGVVQSNPKHGILEGPLALSPRDLGWSGDQIVDYDRGKWNIVTVVEGTSGQPAMLQAFYGNGCIVYSTCPLSEIDRVLYNILVWNYGRLDKNLNIAVLRDVWYPEYEPESFTACFTKFREYARATGQEEIRPPDKIRQFSLINETLRGYGVLILPSGWGDAYDLPDWSWNRHRRDDAILRFVEQGGLLLLSEAGYVDSWGEPIDSIQQVFRLSDPNILIMVQISIVSIWGLYTVRWAFRGMSCHLDIVYSLLLMSGIYWYLGLVSRGQLLPYPHFFILCGFFSILLAIAIVLCLGLVRLKAVGKEGGGSQSGGGLEVAEEY